MNSFFSKTALLGVALLLAAPLAFAEVQVPPAPQGYVLDEANVLSEATEATLQTQLAALDTETSTQMVVYTTNDLQGYEPEQFALAVGRGWGLGQEGSNNGLLFLISPEEQVARVEVGYGLEGAITDAQSSSILNQVAIPSFKNNDYDTGVLQSIDVLEGLARGENFEVPEPQASSGDLISIFFFFILPLLWALASVLSGTKSWWLGGVFGGIFGAFVYGASGFVLGLLTGLFVDYILSTYFFGKLVSGTGSGSMWGGGSGRSGGGGFGGFGGGSFGGGGATGRW